MHYNNKQLLTQQLGNNAFAWERRCLEYTRDPILHIPALIDGTLDDVRIGEDIVFEEIEDGKLKSCVGLENFVRLRHCDEGSNPANTQVVPDSFPGSRCASR